MPDAYFSATKIKWILDNVDGARARAERGELAFGTVDTYLLWQLSKGKIFATDYTNASRTMLFNIHTLKWDEELLRLFDIPASMLPEVHPSSHLYGCTDARLFGSPIPVAEWSATSRLRFSVSFARKRATSKILTARVVFF